MHRNNFKISIDDVSINIWSGYECIHDRIVAQSQTWIRHFPDVNIFTDYFPRKYYSKIVDIAKPSKIHIHELGNCARHLWRPNGWERAQPRFVKSMDESFNQNSSKKWYAFLDDDSYISRDTLIDIVSRFNESEPIVIGKFYCAWPDVVFGKDHSQDCLSFPQGGAGVVISNSMMKLLKPHFLECNKKYNDRHYAGSMRFAKCISDYIDPETWKFGKGIQNFKSQFFSRPPLMEIEDGLCNRPPATFHKLLPKEILFAHNGMYSQWTNSRNEENYVSWSRYACRKIKIPYENNFDEIFLRFGYALTEDSKNSILSKAVSPIYPTFEVDSIFNETQVPKVYQQEFSGSVHATFHCCDECDNVTFYKKDEGEIINFHFRIKCPEVKVL
ncbi:hypothetical protein TVAG_178080 [Trichomonas vaginalis G3]|uniref:N-acetylgalactosaminide beta-1,3-galactosyltransferase n=1 Tax=Trichomonas vaginalis (strain ATCC PRA-98 / G3) TaxID=412133 RepID=A2DIG0_TRIV3|nr:glycosyltransferase family 31 protein family [Trichomonas vaginalis G3]EAY19764.1 hypothetical protein TVAG_178080 [Trichomonas vaginalis G3]KAI5523939.1 glycosyltransferase family 31 protein family [Trichomonas vaginalis G3]|eukprot:XP_001580750.1 hypothetical protein [Trichomonas vaginalis G3]